MTPPPDRSSPELLLLGGIELRGAPEEAAARLLAQPKVVGLLAHLAVAPERRFRRRDTLAALLWPELDQTHARTALRKAVHAVRSALGAATVVSRGDEEIAVPRDALETDAARFAEAADGGLLVAALHLYRGELMPGFHVSGCWDFDYWLEDARSAAQERASAAAWALACQLESDSRLTDAGLWARRAVRYTAGDERVLRRAMKMLMRVGDRTGALRLFEEFARRARQTLDAAPSPETVELLQTLRAP